MSERLADAEIEQAITAATVGRSHVLDLRALNVWGFSYEAFRCLVNNLCHAKQPVVYLEVGVFCGATLAAAMSGNEGTFIGVDDFSFAAAVPMVPEDFRDRPQEFCRGSVEWVMRTFGRGKGRFLEVACEAMDVRTLPQVDVFLFDGDHSLEGTARGFAHFVPCLAPDAIVIVDDYGAESVCAGVGRAMEETGLRLEAPFATVGPRWATCVFVAQRESGGQDA